MILSTLGNSQCVNNMSGGDGDISRGNFAFSAHAQPGMVIILAVTFLFRGCLARLGKSG